LFGSSIRSATKQVRSEFYIKPQRPRSAQYPQSRFSIMGSGKNDFVDKSRAREMCQIAGSPDYSIL
jgi:hypothetical protein